MTSKPNLQANSTIDEKSLRYWLALLRSPGIGPARFAAILENFPDLEEVFTAPADIQTKCGIFNPDWKGVDNDLAWVNSSPQHHIITLQDVQYPLLLQQTVNPPPVLFIKGDVDVLSQLQFAIVGSRNPTPLGIETTKNFAENLTKSGLVITSGLALGIDAAAHSGALTAGGKTIAVLGTSLDIVYPKQHRALAEEIAHQGALVSEFPIGTPALPENFPRRNRIVSGMSIGTLVTEATLRSGSLITARLANEQGREVFALPGSIHNPLARGCHALIKQGAKMVETAADILEELGQFMTVTRSAELWHNRKFGDIELGSGVAPIRKSKLPNTTAGEMRAVAGAHLKLLECVGFEATPIDRIVELSGYSVNEAASMLLILELEGYIKPVLGGYLREGI